MFRIKRFDSFIPAANRKLGLLSHLIYEQGCQAASLAPILICRWMRLIRIFFPQRITQHEKIELKADA